MSRFDFLKNDFPDLYDLCITAEQTNDLDLAMLKCRQVIEKVVHLLGAQNRDLFQNLNELEQKDVLDNNISRIFHTIRTLANQSIHNKKKGASPSKVKMCLDFLFEATIWFCIKQGKHYKLSDFSHNDIPIVRKYLSSKDEYTLQGKDIYHIKKGEKIIDPLAVHETLTADSANASYTLRRDIFETKEEYGQRIASMPPVPIGTATLDMRHQDGYTKIVFLVHQIVNDKRFHIPSIDAFFVDTSYFSANTIFDGQLVAKLKILNGQIWCDCNQIYLHKEDKNFPVQIIRWNKLGYETDVDYQKRIEKLPLIPFAVASPIKNDYNLKNSTLPFVLKPFQYTEKIFNALFPEKNAISISCDRHTAKRLCKPQKKILLFGKVDIPLQWHEYILWEKYAGKLAQYPLNDINSSEQIISFSSTEEDAEAQRQLGNKYFKGEGVKRNFYTAVHWYQLSAEQGNIKAQYSLGFCYYYGKGTIKNFSKAVSYWQKAAERGHVLAQYNLGICYYKGDGIEQNYQRAKMYWQKAAEQGNSNAQYNLGVCYYQGKGTEENRQEAIKWWQKASEKNNEPAKKLLQKFRIT